MTLPILEGLDGVQKMSKSLGNYVGIADTPADMFGKLMSVSDDLMWRYFELLSARSPGDIEALSRSVQAGANPRDIKFQLADELVGRFHGIAAAESAHQDFVARFQRGQIPQDLPEIVLQATSSSGLPIAQLLKGAGLVSSTSEAMRMIAQGAVKVGGERVSDEKLLCVVGESQTYQVGKRRFARVLVKKAVDEG
jgi:tyrosyl-tRNA synthetase